MNDPIQQRGFGTLIPMVRDPKKSAIALVMALGLAATACAGDPETSAPAAEETTTSAAPTTAAPATATEAPAESDTTTSAAPTTAAPATAAPTTAAPTTAAPSTAQPAPVAFDLPSVELTNVRTGSTVNLTSVADGKPLVLWFWAPH